LYYSPSTGCSIVEETWLQCRANRMFPCDCCALPRYRECSRVTDSLQSVSTSTHL
jgi:hypothetical protein